MICLEYLMAIRGTILWIWRAWIGRSLETFGGGCMYGSSYAYSNDDG